MKKYQILKEKIEDASNIIIYHHVIPDGDAMFSSLAFYEFLKSNFKNKNIKIAGKDQYDIISVSHEYNLNEIENGLAIVLDTSNVERIDDQDCLKAKYLVKIDHHPVVDSYGMLNIEDDKCAACSELIANILFSDTFNNYSINSKVCEYLYCALITDTINFRTTSTTYKTMEIAAKLARIGKLEISTLVEHLLDVNLDTFEKITKIRNELQIENKLGYVVLNQKKLAEIKISDLEAKNQVRAIGDIKDLNIWIIAVENQERSYNVSLRSKRNYKINDYAAKYHGGGHNNAAGIKNISLNDLHALIKELSIYSLNG